MCRLVDFDAQVLALLAAVQCFTVGQPFSCHHMCSMGCSSAAGHYINEARAAGALIISTDHQPMNELVTNDSGVLIRPARTASYNDWMALGEFANINAFLGPDDICSAVQAVLHMTFDQRAAKGREARRQYLQGKSQFVHKLKRLRVYVSHWRHKGSNPGRKGDSGDASNNQGTRKQHAWD